MEKIQHKAFMDSNKLEIAAFSEPVQKKAGIFDKMHSKLEDTVEDDRKELLKQLKELDHEIQEDMLNELEDQLENNEVVEEPKKEKPKPAFKKGDTVEITGGNSKYVGVIGTVAEHHAATEKDKEAVTVAAHELPDGKALYNVEIVKATSKKPAPPPKKAVSDESILDELWKLGRTRGLSRSFLKDCGIKANISGWTVPIGKYALHRTAVFSYKYNLQKLN